MFSKSSLWSILVVLASFVVLAQEATGYDPKNKPSNEAERKIRQEWLRQRRYEHTGGDVLRANTQKGSVSVIVCTHNADREAIDESVSYLSKESKFLINVCDGSFDIASPQLRSELNLFVVDEERLPMLLTAPEGRWCVMNVAPLREGRGSAPAFYKARIKKEMSRAFAALCGGMSSNYPGSLTGGIYKPSDLDRISDQRLSVDVIARFAPTVASCGVSPAVYTTYLKACQEGWAPAPTNDVQKAVWDRVHEAPISPIKLKK